MTDPAVLLARGLLAHPHDVVVLLRAVRDAGGDVVDFVVERTNEAGDRLLGTASTGRRLAADLIPGPGRHSGVAFLAHVLATSGAEVWRRRSDLAVVAQDDPRVFDVFACAVDAEHVTLHVRDVSDEVRLQERLEHQALHDPLTGLPSRRWLGTELDRALAEMGPDDAVAILFCDVDHFKVVNDSLGHAAGDDLLLQIAGRVAAVLRPPDSVARFGGDELVVLCASVHRASAAADIAARLHEAATGRYTLGDATVDASLSVGVAVTDAPVPGERLLARADIALYEAKRRGRGRVVVYDDDLGRARRRRLETHHDLDAALEEAAQRADGDGGLALAFQPKVDLATGRVVGAEALLRWTHPTRGPQAPADVLPVAEATGLMPRLGAWVLRSAFDEARRWPVVPDDDASGRPRTPTVQVNLSTRELLHPAVLDSLAEALEGSGLDPRRVEVEITETDQADDIPRLTLVLDAIRELGAAVALDDFGTGYSSLQWLRQFPVSTVKLDRSFVARLDTGRTERAIVRSTVELAHALDLVVVAEGIETPEQLAAVRELGCDFGQGFLLGRPAPAAALRALLVG